MAYNRYFGREDFQHTSVQRTGVLVVNLGTPDAPTKKALRPYLKQFLFDPRVIEVHPAVWWFVMNCFVLPFRPKRSAALYQKVWTDDGSPLLIYTKGQAEGLEKKLQAVYGDDVVVEYAMRIGNPSLDVGLKALAKRGATRLLVLPMFAHYSGTTTASVFDGVTEELQKWRWVPEFRMINQFHDQSAYIEALARSVTEAWERDGKPEKLVMSFHGIPKRYFLNGDPYFCQCHKTGRLLAERLGLEESEYMVCFQSLFGKEEWLKPYTEETVEQLAKSGTKSLDVICPGFASDCLETIDEIDREIREVFEENGGEQFRYIPCLNDRDDFIELLSHVCQQHLQGWVEPLAERSADTTELAAKQTDERFRAMRAA